MTREQARHTPLTAVMAHLGYRHARDAHSHQDSRHAVWKGDEFIGRFSAPESWQLIEREHFGGGHAVA